MIYLLDVNALIGLALAHHSFHEPVATWVVTLDASSDRLASCSITELGLVRIVPQTSGATSVKDAQTLLAQVKITSVIPFTFLPDPIGGDRLPKWVRDPKQTTDGHLLELAKSHGATLSTFDRGIPGAFLIPS